MCLIKAEMGQVRNPQKASSAVGLYALKSLWYQKQIYFFTLYIDPFKPNSLCTGIPSIPYMWSQIYLIQYK